MLSSSPYPDLPAVPISQLLENAKKWQESFNKPLPLGVKKAVSIVTCMVQLAAACCIAAAVFAVPRIACIGLH